MRRHTHNNSGFTLIELLVVIAIIAVLAAILFPVMTSTRGSAKKSKCLNNMKQMGMAVRMYMDDNNDTFPLDSHYSPFSVWMDGLRNYSRSKLLYRCPSDLSRNFREPLPGYDAVRVTSYGTNFYMAAVKPEEEEWMPADRSTWSHGFVRASDFATPSRTIYICEVVANSTADHVHPAWWRSGNSDGNFIPHDKEVAVAIHQNGSNYVFIDGHVKWMKFDETWRSDGSIDLWDTR